MMDQCKHPYPRRSCDSPATSFPEQPGTYAIILHVENTKRIKIGALGEHAITSGFYAYVGSAFGPGGLRARLRHHLRNETRTRAHWHIDYLRSIANAVGVWWTTDAVKREHDWAMVFQDKMNLTMPIAGFGSSDCDCVSHLFHSRKLPNEQRFAELMHSCCANHAMISSVPFTSHHADQR